MSYGTGTRSYNRSPEKRSLDKERKRITEEYKPGESVTMPLICTCAAWPRPHETFLHKRIISTDSDWRSLWNPELRRLWRPPQEADSMGLETASRSMSSSG
jgi:hypothetical protein